MDRHAFLGSLAGLGGAPLAAEAQNPGPTRRGLIHCSAIARPPPKPPRQAEEAGRVQATKAWATEARTTLSTTKVPTADGGEHGSGLRALYRMESGHSRT